jgi:hypothetical protein
VLRGEDLWGLFDFVFVLSVGERPLGWGFGGGLCYGMCLEVDGEYDFGALKGEHGTWRGVFFGFGGSGVVYMLYFFLFFKIVVF